MKRCEANVYELLWQSRKSGEFREFKTHMTKRNNAMLYTHCDDTGFEVKRVDGLVTYMNEWLVQIKSILK